MAHPFNTINLFVIDEIQKARQWTANPGPQYADDPVALLHVMQRTMQQFHDTNLTQEQVKRLHDHFATEAQQFRQRYHQYIPHDAYKGVLDDIQAMLDRMKTRA